MTDGPGTPTAAEGSDEPSRHDLDGAGRRKNGREQSGYHRASRILLEAAGRQRAIYNLRTQVGKANAAKRDALIAYCGGEEQLTPVLQETIHATVKTALLMDFVDGYLAKLGEGMIHKRKKKLQPIVLERQQLADSLLRHLERLEASIAARQKVGHNEIADAWAAAVRSANDVREMEEWWKDAVTKNRGARNDLVADRGLSLSVERAEELTGITKQQVSKWRCP